MVLYSFDLISIAGNLLAMQPNYIYAIGNGICKTRINTPDTEERVVLRHLQCFESDVGHVRALGFHSHAELLFYSDVDKGTIHRKRMTEADEDSEVIVVQTGLVTGKRNVSFKMMCYLPKLYRY